MFKTKNYCKAINEGFELNEMHVILADQLYFWSIQFERPMHFECNDGKWKLVKGE